jgi:hypothetical protein
MIYRLTLDLETPTVSAKSGITLRYWPLETLHIGMPTCES